MTNILGAACLAGTIFSLSIVPGEAQSQSKEGTGTSDLTKFGR